MNDEMRLLQKARRLAKTGVAQQLREEEGLSRAEFAYGQPYTVAALIAWEKGRRRPRGPKGVAYGRQLEDLTRQEVRSW